MALSRPDGYFHVQDAEYGSLTISENDPGLGAVRISWKPTGAFDADRRVEFRLPLEVWNRIVAQKNHESAMKAAALPAKVKAAKVS